MRTSFGVYGVGFEDREVGAKTFPVYGWAGLEDEEEVDDWFALHEGGDGEGAFNAEKVPSMRRVRVI